MRKLISLTLSNNSTIEYSVAADSINHELAALDTVIVNPVAVHQITHENGDVATIPARNILYYTVIGADLLDDEECEALEQSVAESASGESAVTISERGVTLTLTPNGVSGEDVQTFLAAVNKGMQEQLDIEKNGAGWRDMVKLVNPADLSNKP